MLTIQQKRASEAPRNQGRWLLWALVSALLAGGLLLAFNPNYRWNPHKGDSPYGSDFLQEWTAASMIGAARANQLYDTPTFDAWQHDASRIGFSWNAAAYYPSVYPPPYYWLASPLRWIEYRWAVIVWLSMLLAGWLAAVATVEFGLRQSANSKAFVWFWPAMLLFPAVLQSLSMGQKGTLWLLIWALTWLLANRQRPFAAGLVFGLLSIKPTLFFLLPIVMLGNRQWRFLAGASLSFGGLWLTAATCLPTNVWSDYLEVARGAGAYHQQAGYELSWTCNLQSLCSGVEGWLPVWGQWLLLSLLAGYVCNLLWRLPKFSLSDPLHVGQVLLATCLLSPHYYVYDLVVLLLPIRILWATQRFPAQLLLAAVGLGMLSSQLCQHTVGLPIMPLVLLGALYWLSTVTPGQSSVRKGVSGNPTPSYILHTGLSPQA